jgi:hypothetical protein
MSNGKNQSLAQLLAAKRHAIVAEWLARTLQSYPEHASRFLLQEKDPFHNPVGRALREGLPVLFDQCVSGRDAGAVTSVLDEIVRIRAVQDFTAGQAVAFIFLLKQVMRDALREERHRPPEGDDLAVMEGRIDQMTLLAFDLFMRCRERIYEIKGNEAKRRTALLERMYAPESSVGVEG